MKAAVITDLHFIPAGAPIYGERQGAIADRLLMQAAAQLLEIKPDLLILCGDLVNDPADLDSLKKLRTVIDRIDLPMLVIPGNHDPLPEAFYTVMPRPSEYIDVGQFRFVPFFDKETAGYNSVRSAEDIARMNRYRREFSGRIVSVQHTPLFEAGTSECCYAVENAAEVINGSFDYAVSGHYHYGTKPAQGKHITSWIVPALCEKPFRFAVIDFGDGGKAPEYRVLNAE